MNRVSQPRFGNWQQQGLGLLSVAVFVVWFSSAAETGLSKQAKEKTTRGSPRAAVTKRCVAEINTLPEFEVSHVGIAGHVKLDHAKTTLAPRASAKPSRSLL